MSKENEQSIIARAGTLSERFDALSQDALNNTDIVEALEDLDDEHLRAILSGLVQLAVNCRFEFIRQMMLYESHVLQRKQQSNVGTESFKKRN